MIFLLSLWASSFDPHCVQIPRWFSKKYCLYPWAPLSTPFVLRAHFGITDWTDSIMTVRQLQFQDKSRRKTFSCSHSRAEPAQLGARLIKAIHPALEVLWRWLFPPTREEPIGKQWDQTPPSALKISHYPSHDSFIVSSTFYLWTQVIRVPPVLFVLIHEMEFLM